MMHVSLLLAVLSTLLPSALSKDAEPPKGCAHIKSPTTGNTYDLSVLSLFPPNAEGHKAHKDDREDSWHARGWDYGANFTLNFCAPVLENLEDVVGIDDKAAWKNISAYYRRGGKTYSIGNVQQEPIVRGRKVVLNYTDGSPCPSTPDRRDTDLGLGERDLISNPDDGKKKHKGDDEEDKPKKGSGSGSGPSSARRKSTIISFVCDRDPLAPKAAASFVGTTDDCTYMFEVRAPSACGGTRTEESDGVGPASVFGLIALIAIGVYVLGGIAYQRTVMHQRGWRQLPNYTMWAGLWSFIKASN